MFTGGAAVEAVATPLSTVDVGALVPPTSCVYVTLDDDPDDVNDAVAFVDPVLPEIVVVKLFVAIVLPLKSEGTVATGASSLNIALLPVTVTISTDELSSCAVITLAMPRRRNSRLMVIGCSLCISKKIGKVSH